MSDHADFDEDASKRTYTAPYTSHRPIPTVQSYEGKLQERENYNVPAQQEDHVPVDVNKKQGIFSAAKQRLLHPNTDPGNASVDQHQQPYESANRHRTGNGRDDNDHRQPSTTSLQHRDSPNASDNDNKGDLKDTSEATSTSNNPRQKRKNMKKTGGDFRGREVTDPITHLPVTIHDATDAELGSVPENEDPCEYATGGKDDSRQWQEAREQQVAHSGMEALFPPPSLEASGKQFASILSTALTVGMSFLLANLCVLLYSTHSYYSLFNSTTGRDQNHGWSYLLVPSGILLVEAIMGALVLWALRTWVEKKVLAVWQDGIWDGARTRELESSKSSLPESVQWLNSLLASVWPLINPDLFTSLSDTLEDVMQASLPKLVRMISVEDLGQGNEAIRILGIKWLPTGNAKKNVSVSGQVQESTQTQGNDRKVPNEGETNSEPGKSVNEGAPSQVGDAAGTEQDGPTEDHAIAEGLEAEEGDFVNVEVGFSYRASSTGKSMKVKAKNAHLYLLFYLPGSIRFQYVAPKSLTVDLKDMLIGDDFKKDTSARGVLVVTITHATEFKEGDRNLGGLMKGSSDAYVAVGWAKFGKPVWSTRIIIEDMKPSWHETAYILVSPEELNASERLRVQLWDSDRTSADDDLGRIEVDLKELMTDSRSSGRMWQREDGFQALTPSEEMPGRLVWSVGYFPKDRIQREQIEKQSLEAGVNSLQQLKDKVAEDVSRKMREAFNRAEFPEMEQQEAQDLKVREDNMIASTSPPQDSSAGILSIQIHQISGLELERINKPRDDDEVASDIAEGSDDLPSSYCTVILNHQKIFKTRTKPKSSNPFFNAGTERFVRNRSLGWDYGTIEIQEVTSRSDDLPASLHGLRLKLRTSINRGKMYLASENEGQMHWHGKKDQPVRLAVQQRYRSCLVIEFRKNKLGLDQTPAFAVLWLQDVTDELEQAISLPVFGGDGSNLKRAESNYSCDVGRQIGSIAVTMKLWRGLGRYHRRLAGNNPNVKDVMETLDTAMDSREVQSTMAEGDSSDEDSSSSDSSDSEEDSQKASGFRKELKATFSGGKGAEDMGNNPLKEFQEYNDHSDQLHRHHRGLMQWKGARTAKWMKTRLEDGKDKIANSLKHHDRNPGIETEV
ncbi:MAG: hypothetical protein Q9186_004319 [Xanthomendoza sp. 1 TL-2023]